MKRWHIFFPTVMTVILTVTMISLLTACGVSKGAGEGESAREYGTEVESANTGAAEAGSANTDDTDSGISGVTGETGGITKGYVEKNNQVYQNEFFGFSIKIPSLWHYLSAEELNEVNDCTEAVSSMELEDILEQEPGYTEMVAMNGDGDSIEVLVQKLPEEYVSCDENTLAEAVMASDEKQLEQLGYTEISMNLSTCTRATWEHPVIAVEAVHEEEPVFIKKILAADSGYLCMITVGAETIGRTKAYMYYVK